MIQVKDRISSWIDQRKNVKEDSEEQLEWAANVVEYVSYMWKNTTVRNGAKRGITLPLKKEILIFGPRFLPPAYMHLRKRNATPNIVPKVAYLKPLHIVHPFYYPNLNICPQCQSQETSWQGWTTSGHREVHGLQREETALGYQLECKDCKKDSGTKTYCFATTNMTFWAKKEHWSIPREC